MRLLIFDALATIVAPTINVVQNEQMANETNSLNINVTKKFLALTSILEQVVHKVLADLIFVTNNNWQNLNFSITGRLLEIQH